MPRQLFDPLLLLLLTVATMASSAAAALTLTYDPSLQNVMDHLSLGGTVPAVPLDLMTRPTASVADVTLHLSPFVIPTSLRNSAFVMKPFAVVSMCLASTVSTNDGMTLAQIGDTLRGVTGVAASSNASRWIVASPLVSSSSVLLLKTLVANGITGFTSATAWPAAVLANPLVTIVTTDADISAALTACPVGRWCVGPQFSAAPWGLQLPCLRTRRTVDLTGDTTSYTPRLTATTSAMTIVDADGSVYTQGSVYPFIGGIMLSVHTALSCADTDDLLSMLTAFMTNSSNGASLESLGLQALPNLRNSATLNQLLPANCTPAVMPSTIIGDVKLSSAVAALNFDWYTNAKSFVGFTTTTTTLSIATVYGGKSTHAALVEGLPNATWRATRPSVAAAPLFAQSVSVAYQLNGRDGLSTSLCTLLGMLNGSITYWDDPAVVADNVGLQLPHVKIIRVVNFAAATEVAGFGVTYLSRRCGVQLAKPYTTYPFAADRSVSSLAVVSTVQATEGAMGLVPSSRAIASNLQQLSLRLPSGIEVQGTNFNLAGVVAASTLNASTNEVVFPPASLDYFPFVAIVYALVDTDAVGGCAAHAATVRWLRYVASEAGNGVIVGANEVSVLDAMRAITDTMLASVKGDGVALFPVTTPAFVWWPYAVIGAVVVAVIAAVASRAAHRAWLLGVRPTDPTKAVAVMFVGIKNQAAVLEAGEENAAAVHRVVSETVRRVVRKHRCYEARRIDVATMMIVGKSAQQTVACAEEVVLELSLDVQWLQDVMTQPMPLAARAQGHRNRSHSNSFGTPSSDGVDAAPDSRSANRRVSQREGGSSSNNDLDASNNNLKRSQATHSTSGKGSSRHGAAVTLKQCIPEVYAGVHWTHVMIDVDETLDTVTYMGAGVAAAACVADLAVAGQVTVSQATMKALQPDAAGVDGSTYSFTVVGDSKSSDEGLVVLSLTTPRFPEWLIARAARRRKSLEEKDQDGTATNMIAAAMASANGALARRRIAVVSLLLRDLARDGADGRTADMAEALQELHDIVTANRGQIHPACRLPPSSSSSTEHPRTTAWCAFARVSAAVYVQS